MPSYNFSYEICMTFFLNNKVWKKCTSNFDHNSQQFNIFPFYTFSNTLKLLSICTWCFTITHYFTFEKFTDCIIEDWFAHALCWNFVYVTQYINSLFLQKVKSRHGERNSQRTAHSGTLRTKRGRDPDKTQYLLPSTK